MIDFARIRTDILIGLRTYLRTQYAGIFVIEANPGAPKPSKPYLTMLFTSPYIPEGERSIITYANVPSLDPNFDFDLEETRYSNDTMSCSFNIYGQDPDEAVQVGLMAQEWLKFKGLDYLRSKGIVVEECMSLQNRDTYIVDSWERRQGFDVIFRALSSIKKITPTIETVETERM